MAAGRRAGKDETFSAGFVVVAILILCAVLVEDFAHNLLNCLEARQKVESTV
jgi:hypothetical protein